MTLIRLQSRLNTSPILSLRYVWSWGIGVRTTGPNLSVLPWMWKLIYWASFGAKYDIGAGDEGDGTHHSLNTTSSPVRPCWNSCRRRDVRRWSFSPGRTEMWAARSQAETSHFSNPPSHRLRRDTENHEQWSVFNLDSKEDKGMYQPLL